MDDTKTAGQASHTGRLAAARARLSLSPHCDETWGDLTPEQQGDEEAGASATIGHAADHAAAARGDELTRVKQEIARLDEALGFAEKQDDAWTAAVDAILRHSGERSNLTDEGRREAALGYVRNLEAACKAAGLTVEGPGL